MASFVLFSITHTVLKETTSLNYCKYFIFKEFVNKKELNNIDVVAMATVRYEIHRQSQVIDIWHVHHYFTIKR